MVNVEKPLVSVIVALYNSDKYISQTIDSILSQTYKNIEIIVVDDCSTDESAIIVKNYVKRDERVKYFVLEENSGGPAKPRNIGINSSVGEYVAFSDSDDIWLPTKLEKQLNIMLQKDYFFCHTDSEVIDAADNVLKKPLISKIKKILLYKDYKRLIVSNTIVTSSVVVCRKFLGSARFDEDMYLVAVEDYYLWLFLYNLNDKSCCFLNEELVKYRKYDSSISSGYNRQQLRSMYCLTKHLLLMKNYRLYPLILFVYFVFSVKHLVRSAFGLKKILSR